MIRNMTPILSASGILRNTSRSICTQFPIPVSYTHLSILKNDPDKEFDELRFAVDDGTNILVIINKGEITGAVDIDSMYEFASSHCDDFKDLRDDEDIVINREWICLLYTSRCV